MDESFMLLQSGDKDITSDYDDSVIVCSDESICENFKNSKVKQPSKATSVFIPESEDDEPSTDNGAVDSPLFNQRKKKLINVILDSESENDTTNKNNTDKNGNNEKRFTSESNDEDRLIEDDLINAEEMDDTIHMSAVTRLSIFGKSMRTGKNVVDDSDDSDFIYSDAEKEDENSDSDVSLSEMAPNPGVYETPSKPKNITNMSMDISKADVSKMSIADTSAMSIIEDNGGEIKIEPEKDDVQIVEKESPIIHISSDEEFPEIDFDVNKGMKNVTSTPVQAKIKQFFQRDKTYPNSNVIYVSRRTKEHEMNEMNEIKVDLYKVNYLLENMKLMTLPDGGKKLLDRRDQLKVKLREYQEKISNMVVEAELNEPVKPWIKNEDLYSWDDLKNGATAVQPRTFGAQAMNTHLTQKSLTLEKLRDLHASLETRPAENQTIDPPRALVTPLMAHQLQALTWLVWRETQKPRGGILADDMGLGKTLTMISLIVHANENNIDFSNGNNISDDEEDPGRSKRLSSGGTLVVCPASLLKQWYGEIQNHCKKYTLKVEIHHGLKRETKANRLAMNDVVITTYNLVMRDLEKNGTLMRIRWQRVILDEAHTVRNHKAQTSKAVFKLSSWARWCLTGTPVHNKDLDLFALLKFLRCAPFDDIALWKKWIDNKSTGGQERLTTIMKTILLRRTKQQLQENKSLGNLPEKRTIYIEVKLTADEMHVYQKVLVFSKTLFAQFLQQRTEHKINTAENAGRNVNTNEMYYKVHKKMAALHGAHLVKSHEILVLLLRLRQICCHPGLIHSMLDDEQYEGESNTQDQQMNILSNLSKMNITVDPDDDDNDEEAITTPAGEGISVADAVSKILSSSNPVFDFKNRSAKIDAIVKCLEENVCTRKGDKAIIVSQWTSMLEIVEQHIKRLGFQCSTLSGKVPVTARHEIIKQFNDPNSKVEILLLSLCAGGVGLNLVGANHLLLVDLHWNPQLEAQAQDRIYRVGQKKPVFIYKFMCLETVEHSIKMIQDKKLSLSENLLTGVKVQSSKVSIEDLKILFHMNS